MTNSDNGRPEWALDDDIEDGVDPDTLDHDEDGAA